MSIDQTKMICWKFVFEYFEYPTYIKTEFTTWLPLIRSKIRRNSVIEMPLWHKLYILDHKV